MGNRHRTEGNWVLLRARRFAEAHGRELTVGAVRWHYVRLGSGPPVLWLTGGLRRAAHGSAFLVLSSSGPADYGRRWLPMLALAAAVVCVLPRPLLTRLLVRGLSGRLPSASGARTEWIGVLRRTIGRDLTRADAVSHFAVAADAARRRLVHPGRFARWSGDVVVLRAENDRTQKAKDISRPQRLLGRPVRVVSMGSAGHTAVLLEPERYAQWLEDALAVRSVDA